MNSIKLSALTAVLAALAFPGVALAQHGPQVGGSITGSASAHDNIFAGPNNEVSDTVWGVSGRINWGSKDDMGSFGVWGSVDLERYADNSDEDADDFGVGLHGSRSFDGGGQLSFSASHEVNTEDRRDRMARRDTNERVEYSTNSAEASLGHRFSGVMLTGSVSIEAFDYDDARIRTTLVAVDQDHRDRTSFGQSIKASFPESGGASWFISASRREIDYDLSPPASLHQRDSESASITGGVDFTAASNVTGSISAGWTSRSFDHPAFDDVSTIEIDVGLKWAAGPDTNWRVFVDRSIEESTLANSSSYVSTVIGGSLNHSFGNRLGVRLSLQKEWNAHEGIDRDDDVWEAAVGVTARLTSSVEAAFTYTMTSEDSDGVFASPGYDVGVAAFSLTASF